MILQSLKNLLNNFKGFIMRLVVIDMSISYEPSFKDFETALINLIEIIIKACSYIPRVETRLYSDSMASSYLGQLNQTQLNIYFQFF